MNARPGLKRLGASRHIESVAHRVVWKTTAMSAAQVANSTMSSPISRVAAARGGRTTTLQSIETIDTQFATRGRDDFGRNDEIDDFEALPARRRRGEFQEEVVRFSGVLLSREVGTTMMQAQAAASRQAPGAIAVGEAERNVAMYEFNQSLMGMPEPTNNFGIMH
jgi:hypothetical protein